MDDEEFNMDNMDDFIRYIQQRGEDVEAELKRMAFFAAYEGNLPTQLCADFEAECKEVKNPSDCWCTSPTKGYCPLMYGMDITKI